MPSSPPRTVRRRLRRGTTLVTAALTLVGSGAIALSPGASAAPTSRAAAAAPLAQPAVTGGKHTVSYDDSSFMVDGKRLYIWSGEYHYFRQPSPDLWRDTLQKMKAAGYNAASIYFDWGYHSPKQGVYDFTGVRDVDRLLAIANEVGIYVIARPGPYINAEVDSGGFPGWLTTQEGRARSTAPDYLSASDEWLSQIDAIIARHQVTNGTGSVLLYQVENEFYDDSAPARAYMAHLEDKARADGITVPLTGNNNATFAAGDGKLDVDGPDSYPQGFDCRNPTVWRGVDDISYAKRPGTPLYTPEYQGGAFDPWGGPGYDACRQLTGPDFERVFYKNNIAVGATAQSFYMTYGGTSWGWLPDPSQVYTSYDYGAPITEARQLSAKYDEVKRIGYATQSLAPLTKTVALAAAPIEGSAIVDTARINPDDRTQFHVLRHADSTSTATDRTHIGLDLGVSVGFTYDDTDEAITYAGAWESVGASAGYTGGDYQQTESFSSTAGDSVTVPFSGTSVRWISGLDSNHGIADVYLDGTKVATVDTYGPSKSSQTVAYTASGLAAGEHVLRIVATGTSNAAANGTFVVVDAIDLPSAAGGDKAFYPVVPQQLGTALTFAGRDSKMIVADYQLGASHLQYSTSEIITSAQINGSDVAVLYGRNGQDGETVLRYAARPQVQVLDGSVESTYDAATGDLRLNYAHSGLARVLVTGGAKPLLLLLGTDETAAQFWCADTAAGPVLVRGPSLLRTAATASPSSLLALTGETQASSPLEVFAAPTRTITWNGKVVGTSLTSSGSRSTALPGPQKVSLPALTGWSTHAESPESAADFDDSTWQVADEASSNSTTTPASLPVLFADDYGFHTGDVWYRGRYTGRGDATGITLSAVTGRAGVWTAWLDGQLLGSSTSSSATFPIPGSASSGDHVISVLVENMGHNEDYGAADSHKEARGLTGASLVGALDTAITWRIQGKRGGEDLVDPVRGAFNSGGLYGERAGWSLPGFPHTDWTPVTLPAASTGAGVRWYRTDVALNLPTSQDTSVGIRIDDDPSRHYRAQIFVNGWMMGRYVNDVGPQHSFPIPNGILRTKGTNTIALAVWSTDATSGGLGTVSLESYGSPLSTLQVADVAGPRYSRTTYAMPGAPSASLRLEAPDALEPGGTVPVTARFSVPAGAGPATGVSVALQLPQGWTSRATTSASVARVAPGTSFDVSFAVTEPSEPSPASVLRATATYTQAGRAQTLGDAQAVRVPLVAPPAGANAVSGLPWQTSTNGWGPVERDTSVGEQASGDGNPIMIDGTVYAKGLGTNAASDVTIYTGGTCSRFTAMVGVDDEVGSQATVTFAVLADGKELYRSPVLRGTSAAVPVDVDLGGAQTIDLVVGDGGDGNGSDHADWATPVLTCGSAG